MTRNLALFFLLMATGGCSSDKATVQGGPDSGPSKEGGPSESGAPTVVHKIDRSHLANTGTTMPFDYSDPALWLCQPGNDPNECLTSLDATEFLADGSQQVDKHTVAKNPPFDCFYVYPTVDLKGDGNMTDFTDISLTLDPLLAQGARFTRLCTLYAPLYRQNSLSIPGSSSGDGGAVGVTGNPTIGYQDVEGAFTYYMDHYNKGRKFVLMGHSQGTFMLTQLITNKFDNDASLREKLISALLIGGGISVPEGKDVGGTFKNIPLCTKQAQTGCVIAYNSFAQVAPPPANSLFGKASGAGMIDACTNPSLLAGNTGRYRGSYSPTKFYNPVFTPDAPMNTYPMVTTPFTMVRNMFSGECKNQNGFSYLEIRPDQAADDKRAVPPYRTTSSEALGFGMHIEDYAIEQDDLIDAVDQQAKAALK